MPEMPDDIEVAEQANKDPAFDNSFDAPPADDKPKGDAEPAKETKLGEEPAKKTPPAKEPAEAKPGEEPKKEVADDTEQTAQEKLEARVAREPIKPVKDDSSHVAPVVTAAPAEKAVEGKDAGLFNGLPALKAEKIAVDGREIPLTEFAEQYPEVAQASLVIGREVAKNMLGEAVKAGEILTKESVAGLQAKVENMEFWQGVSESHSDARKVTGSKEFWDWMEKQAPGIQNLGESLNPADGVAVLDAYKESLAKLSKVETDKVATETKRGRDDLHKGTLREKRTAEGSGKGKEDDFDSGFNSSG